LLKIQHIIDRRVVRLFQCFRIDAPDAIGIKASVY